MTTEIIHRNFSDYFKNPDRDIIDTIKKDILTPLFGADLDRALHALSRAIAGCYEDKNFITYLGNRDCGKGIIDLLLRSSFGDYIGSFELSNVMYDRMTDEAEKSRKLYWLLDLQFVRLAISQETPDDNANMKVDGKLWKKLCGGGDEMIARRNYDRKDTKFTIDTTFMAMGNFPLKFDQKDCKEHEIAFNSVVQFKSAEEIERLRNQGIPEIVLEAYKVKDESLKLKCRTEKYMNAFVYLIYESYKKTPVPISTPDDDDEECKSIRMSILEVYDITKNMNDIVIVKDFEIMDDFGNKKKVMNELLSMGVVKKRSKIGDNTRDKMCYFGLKRKHIEVDEEADNEEYC